MSCLDDVVGIIRNPCPCLTDGYLTPDQIAQLQVSKSGLYLDDLPGGVELKGLNGVDVCRNAIQMAQDALHVAKQWVMDNLTAALNAKYATNKQPFVGLIGEMSYSSTLSTSRAYTGVRLRTRAKTDGTLRITQISIVVDRVAMLTVRLIKAPINSMIGTEIGSWDVTTMANSPTGIDIGVPISLPLLENGQPLEYYIIYDRSAGAMPKNNLLTCGCGNVESLLSQFVQVEGLEVDSPSLLNSKVLDNYAHGIMLNTDMRCGTELFACREYSNEEAVAVVMAYSVWFKAGELLIEKVQQSGQPNRYTLKASEYLWGKRNHFKAEVDTRLPYLIQAINIDRTDCYVCRAVSNTPFMVGIKI